MLLYVLPLVFAVGGIAFPIGVLLYWTTSNLWTMGQQFYVIRRNPAPGTPAATAKDQRDKDRRRKTGAPEPVLADDSGATLVEETPPPAPRQQPKRQTREQRAKGSKPTKSPKPTRPQADGDKPSGA